MLALWRIFVLHQPTTWKRFEVIERGSIQSVSMPNGGFASYGPKTVLSKWKLQIIISPSAKEHDHDIEL